MIVFKVSIVIAGWLIGFIASRKYRQTFLAIPAIITIVVLFIDNSNLDKLKKSLSSLIKSYAPIEETALENHPNLPKEKAIKKYMEDIDRMKADNTKFKEEQTKLVQQIKILEDKDTENKRKLSALKQEALKQQEHQKILQEYSVVASWNYKGYVESGGDISFGGPLSGWLDKFVDNVNSNVSFQCNRTALDNYKEIIKKYPKFPFTYLYIATCLKKAKDQSWENYATKGLNLFEKTTMVPTHIPGHDGGLKMIRDVLQK